MSRTLRSADYHYLYKTRRWTDDVRPRILDAADYRCRFCADQGFTRLATVVDHITPHKGDLKLFWDETNLQALCAPCHNGAKAQIERGGYSAMTNQNGWPSDPSHPQNIFAAKQRAREAKKTALEAIYTANSTVSDPSPPMPL